MKKIQRTVFSILSIVTLMTAERATAAVQNNAAPGLVAGQSLTSGQNIELAQTAPSPQPDATTSASSGQLYVPGSLTTQSIGLAQTMTKAQIKGHGAGDDSTSDSEERFKKNEWDMSVFGVYSDQAGGKWGLGAAGTYFITDKIGVGAVTYWTETGGTVFDNLAAEGYFRIPLFKIVAPYAVASVGHQFDRDYWFETFGGGVDFRAFERISAFSDIQFRLSNNNDKSPNGAILRVGARFQF